MISDMAVYVMSEIKITINDSKVKEDAEKYRLWEAQQILQNLMIKKEDGTCIPAYIDNGDGTFSPNKF